MILAACPPPAPALMATSDALGCVLATTVTATQDIPPFANSAMDGFAVRAADTVGAPVTLEVVGTVAAGHGSEMRVGPDQAVRIMTGAPMPPGADAVVMVERTSAWDERGADRQTAGPRSRPGVTGPASVEVEIRIPAAPGDNVRPAGDDIATGETVFEGGEELGPAHIGVLASLGLATIEAFYRPRVGVLSTGDELVEGLRGRSGPGPLAAGQIRDSNRPTLLALLEQSGFGAVNLGIAPDDEESLIAAVQDGLDRCDALITSGGVSVGDFDHMKAVLDRLGAMNWWQVAVKPAKPLAFGMVGGKPVFGLPGNPVSSMVSFELFARPALRRMAGHRRLERPVVPAVADDGFPRRRDGKVHLVRVAATFGADGRVHVLSSGGQGSHMLRAMAAANALAVLPDSEGVPAGAIVETMLLGPIEGGPGAPHGTSGQPAV